MVFTDDGMILSNSEEIEEIRLAAEEIINNNESISNSDLENDLVNQFKDENKRNLIKHYLKSAERVSQN